MDDGGAEDAGPGVIYDGGARGAGSGGGDDDTKRGVMYDGGTEKGPAGHR
jgi:hypothetical protein